MAAYDSTLSQESDLINSDLEEIIMNELKSNPYPPEIVNLPPEYIEFDGTYSLQELKYEQTEVIEVVVNNESTSPTETFPCMDEYRGPLNFELFLNGSSSSKNSWIYSYLLNKVFLDMNKVLMIQFKINTAVLGLRIRALPVYSLADDRIYPVNRCTVHSVASDPQFLAHKEKSKCLCANYQWVGHVIRSNHIDARYEYDSQSSRHSVTVPLDAVQPGCDTVTVPYHFTCKTSCISGMNRKPIDVIFTLETPKGEVIGRQFLGVKICSCPKRDKSREELDDKINKEDAKRLGIEAPLPRGKCRRKSNANKNQAKKIKIEESPSPLKSADTTNNTVQDQVEQIKQDYTVKMGQINDMLVQLQQETFDKIQQVITNSTKK